MKLLRFDSAARFTTSQMANASIGRLEADAS
jgi:hypothetical protein